MSLSKSTPLRFSRVHGQNVVLSENKCSSTWQIDKHWGNCSINRYLSKGERIDLELTGSGHVYIGILNKKLTKAYILEGRSPDSVVGGHWFHFKLKQNTIVVTVVKTSSKEVTYFISGGDNNPEVFKLDECWVACDLLFGDVEVKLLTTDKSSKKRLSTKKDSSPHFDAICGSNVNLSPEETLVKLRQSNPSAVCGTDRPMLQGEILEIKVQTVQGARWTYVNVYLSNLCSKDLKIDQSDFDCSGSDVKTWLLPLTTLKNSQSTFVVRVTSEGRIAYTVRGEEKIWDATDLDLSQPIFVYFDLFRVNLTLTSVLPVPPDDDGYLTINTLELPSGQTEGNQQEDLPSDYLTPIPPGNVYDDFRIVPDNAPACDDVNGASGPVPEVAITEPKVGMEINELGNRIATLRISARSHCEVYKDIYSGPLREIRQRLVSIEASSDTNHEILHVVKRLERQVSELIIEVMSKTEEGVDSIAPPTESMFESCIKPNFNKFLTDMDPDSVVDFLYQYDVITTDQMDSLQGMAKAERRRKNREILLVMRTKPHKMELFKEALINSGHKNLAEMLK